MKKLIAIALLFIFITFALPFTGQILAKYGLIPGGVIGAQGTIGMPDVFTQKEALADLTILNEGTGVVETVPMRDYLIGAVAAEMPLAYGDEALKAQIVAAHSYALYNKYFSAKNGNVNYSGADFAANPALRKGYVTQDVARAMWGISYDANYDYVGKLVDEVLSDVVMFEGEVALTSYYAISCGYTEYSENVWDMAMPYLIKVDSILDATAPNYETSVTYTLQQMMDLLELGFAGLDLSTPPETWFGEASYSESGYVRTQKVAGVLARGIDIREKLKLRSACYSIYYQDGAFTITTKGYGHGVGMSQYGAYGLALQGKTYEEILLHFYPGTEVVKTK